VASGFPMIDNHRLASQSTAVQTERVAYYRGKIIPESQVLISFRDSAAIHGEGVYDTARTFGGRIFKLREHLDRLWRSMRYLRIEPPVSFQELEEISDEVARCNVAICKQDVWVTQRVSPGAPREFGGDGIPTLIVECLPLPFAIRSQYFKTGISLQTPSVRRTPPWSLSPQAKTVNYLNFILAGREIAATRPGAWPILLNEHGNLTEGGGANIFFVHGNTLSTPQTQYVLPGITRATVIELATTLKLTVAEQDIGIFEASQADEIFLTATSLCVCPVADINGYTPASNQIPGPVTGQLQQAFSALVGIDIVGQYLDYVGTVSPTPPFTG